MPFGYGPAAKLVTLAERLRNDWRLVFAGRGTALELVSRSPDLFDEIVAAPANDPSIEDWGAQAWGVLSLMDREAGELATRLRKPLFVVDSLLWMRPATPRPLRTARVYWAQNFPGLAPEAYQPRPRLVGPVVADGAPRRKGDGSGLVVNLGGSAAPYDRQPLYEAYARFVLKAVVGAGLAARFGRVQVLGGAAVIASLGEWERHPGLTLASLSHQEAARQMAAAEAVLTAPGLTAILECFQQGTPTWFLLPQNYSQWWILQTLRAKGAADDAFHWADRPGLAPLAERMRPGDYNPIVCEIIGRLTDDPESAAQLQSRLVRVGTSRRDRIAAQTAFFNALGSNGVEAIAASLRREFEAERKFAPAGVAASDSPDRVELS